VDKKKIRGLGIQSVRNRKAKQRRKMIKFGGTKKKKKWTREENDIMAHGNTDRDRFRKEEFIFVSEPEDDSTNYKKGREGKVPKNQKRNKNLGCIPTPKKVNEASEKKQKVERENNRTSLRNGTKARGLARTPEKRDCDAKGLGMQRKKAYAVAPKPPKTPRPWKRQSKGGKHSTVQRTSGQPGLGGRLNKKKKGRNGVSGTKK